MPKNSGLCPAWLLAAALALGTACSQRTNQTTPNEYSNLDLSNRVYQTVAAQGGRRLVGPVEYFANADPGTLMSLINNAMGNPASEGNSDDYGVYQTSLPGARLLSLPLVDGLTPENIKDSARVAMADPDYERDNDSVYFVDNDGTVRHVPGSDNVKDCMFSADISPRWIAYELP